MDKHEQKAKQKNTKDTKGNLEVQTNPMNPEADKIMPYGG